MKSPFKPLMFTVLLICSSVLVFSQVDIYWNAGTTAPTSAPPSFVIDNITQNNNLGPTNFIMTNVSSSGYTFSLNGTNTGASASSNFAFNARTGTLNTANNGSAYIEVMITPATGTSLTFDNINFGVRSTDTGPQAYSIQYSVDNGAFTEIATGSITNNSAWGYKNNNALISAEQNQPVTIRIYGYNGVGNPTVGGTPNWRFDDIVISNTTPLPAIFGDVFAYARDKKLNIKWSTLKEMNNSHFEIQVSKDGTEFKTLKTIPSVEGNSNIEQFYEVEISMKDVTSMMGMPLFIIALLCLGFIKRKKAALFFFGLILFGGIASCSKTSMDIELFDMNKVFIRIKQVDVDGKFEYSKVVRVMNDQ